MNKTVWGWRIIEGANLILAGIAALSGVIAARGAIHYGRQGARNQAKQLQLAQKQAEMRPVLAVAEARLLEVEDLEELRDSR